MFGAMKSIGAQIMVFMKFEVFKTGRPIPAFILGDVGPLRIVPGLTAHVNHAIDA